MTDSRFQYVRASPGLELLELLRVCTLYSTASWLECLMHKIRLSDNI
jgi:hypothetical protein